MFSTRLEPVRSAYIIMKKLLYISICISVLLACTSTSFAQTHQSTAVLFEHEILGSDQILDITLKTDLAVLLKDVGEDRKEHLATITYEDASHTTSVPLKLKTRGKFRRNPDNCDFPPLKLNFSKKDSKETLFEGLDKVKLVTHCQQENPAYEQYVIQEYLLYRVYNQLTDLSFKARLVRITYIDTAYSIKDVTRIGFLIEDEDVMAGRHKARVFDVEDLKKPEVDYHQTTLLHLFEYMIGNVDWSVPIHHNLKLIGKDRKDTMIPIPYDFDHADVLNTEYSDDPPLIGTASIRYQLFREFCRSEKELKPFVDLFNSRKEAIYDLYKDLKILGEPQRHRALRYYDRFYQVINTPRKREQTFLRPCKKKELSKN